MEELLKPETVAIIAAVCAAASEIIGILKIESNSIIQLVLTSVKRLVGLK